MLISYCDLCGCPIKGEKYIIDIKKYFHYPPDEPTKYPEELFQKEICVICYHGIMDIFKQRLYKLCEMAEYIEKTYKIPTTKQDEKKEINGNI